MSDPAPESAPTYADIKQSIEAGHASLVAKDTAYRQASSTASDAASQVTNQRKALADTEDAAATATQSADTAKAALAAALREQGDLQHRAANLLDPPAE